MLIFIYFTKIHIILIGYFFIKQFTLFFSDKVLNEKLEKDVKLSSQKIKENTNFISNSLFDINKWFSSNQSKV